MRSRAGICKFWIACALSLLLTACAGRPQGFLLPLASAPQIPGSTQVNMLVATTRSSAGAKPGEVFTGERAVKMSFADIAVSIPPDNVRKVGEVQWPAGKLADPAKEFATLRAETLELPEILARFNRRIEKTAGRRVLLFVHGYNTRFEEAVYRFAQIIHDSRAPALPVLFTWPSRGQLLAYAYDRESANFSRDAMEQVLQALSRDRSVAEIDILAHSMGNWVTLEALRQMAVRDKRISPKIKQVMLAAPDVDVDVFYRQIAQIGPQRPPFVLFVARDDEALALSGRVWGNVGRLGGIDPESEPFRTELKRQNIIPVDLQGIKSADPLGHSKFAESPQIVQLIGGLLAGGQVLSDGKASLGESIGLAASRTAGAIGSTAGLVIAAPVAVVDPDTRDTLNEHVDIIRSHLGAPGDAALPRH